MPKDRASHRRVALGVLGLALCLSAAFPSGAEQASLTVVPVHLDQATDINGYGVACTGIGQAARDDPRWAGYPVRLEFAGPDKSYKADETVTISTLAGKVILAAHCDGPWLLLKLPAGAYKAQAQLGGPEPRTQGATFSPPASGQRRVILTFPRRAGSLPPPGQ